jgi:hypothetical protein
LKENVGTIERKKRIMTKQEFQRFVKSILNKYSWILEPRALANELFKKQIRDVEYFDPKLAQLMRINFQSIEDMYKYVKSMTKG